MIDSGHAGELARYTAHPRDLARAAHSFRRPTAEDAQGIAALIASCPPLDINSLYCNLLQCTHFAATCIVAERHGVVEGWVSGYRPPDDAESLFVWQVAVHERARGMGLGGAMLARLFSRDQRSPPRWLKTTVTASNQNSRRMFARFARQRGADMQIDRWFDRVRHFGGSHESEELISIGPF